MNCCHPPDHSHFLVLGAIKGVYVGEKGGDAGGHHFYPVWLILCSYEGWLRRQPAVFCIRMCLEIRKRRVAFAACHTKKKKKKVGKLLALKVTMLAQASGKTHA